MYSVDSGYGFTALVGEKYDEYDLYNGGRLLLMGKNILNDDFVGKIRHVEYPQRILKVACGFDYLMCITTAGEILGLGHNEHGQMGLQKSGAIVPLVEVPTTLDYLNSQYEVLEVVCGKVHSLLLARARAEPLGENYVFSAGKGTYGVLGQMDEADCPRFRMVSMLKSYHPVGIACSDKSSCVWTKTLELYTFGYGANGNLGHQEAKTVCSIPTFVERFSELDLHVFMASMGPAHTAVLTSSGKIYTFGNSRMGKLGRIISEDGDQVNRPKLVKFYRNDDPEAEELYDLRFGAVYAGEQSTIAVTTEGKMYGFGSNKNNRCMFIGSNIQEAEVEIPMRLSNKNDVEGQVLVDEHTFSSLVGRKVQALRWNSGACAQLYSCLLDNMGRLYTWGYGEDACSGHVNYLTDPVKCYPSLVSVAGGVRFDKVYCGYSHTILLTKGFQVFAFGNNASLQCGLPDNKVVVPRIVDVGAPCKAASCGYSHSVLLTISGAVVTFGENNGAQLGNGTLMPSSIDNLHFKLSVNCKFKAVSAGYNYNLFLSEEDELWANGMNIYNALGFYDDEPKTRPSKVPCGLRLLQVAAGVAHSLAINHEGKLVVWGMSKFVCNEVKNIKTPLILPRLNHEKFVAVEASLKGSWAVTVEGKAYAWGLNEYGQLGIGEKVRFSPNPNRVRLEVSIRSVHSFANHTLLLSRDGEAYACGCNAAYRLGLQEPEDLAKVDKPVLVNGTYVPKYLLYKYGVDPKPLLEHENMILPHLIYPSNVKYYCWTLNLTSEQKYLFYKMLYEFVSRDVSLQNVIDFEKLFILVKFENPEIREENLAIFYDRIEDFYSNIHRNLATIRKKMLSINQYQNVNNDIVYKRLIVYNSPKLRHKSKLNENIAENMILFEKMFNNIYMNPCYLANHFIYLQERVNENVNEWRCPIYRRYLQESYNICKIAGKVWKNLGKEYNYNTIDCVYFKKFAQKVITQEFNTYGKVKAEQFQFLDNVSKFLNPTNISKSPYGPNQEQYNENYLEYFDYFYCMSIGSNSDRRDRYLFSVEPIVQTVLSLSNGSSFLFNVYRDIIIQIFTQTKVRMQDPQFLNLSTQYTQSKKISDVMISKKSKEIVQILQNFFGNMVDQFKNLPTLAKYILTFYMQQMSKAYSKISAMEHRRNILKIFIGRIILNELLNAQSLQILCKIAPRWDNNYKEVYNSLKSVPWSADPADKYSYDTSMNFICLFQHLAACLFQTWNIPHNSDTEPLIDYYKSFWVTAIYWYDLIFTNVHIDYKYEHLNYLFYPLTNFFGTYMYIQDKEILMYIQSFFAKPKIVKYDQDDEQLKDWERRYDYQYDFKKNICYHVLVKSNDDRMYEWFGRLFAPGLAPWVENCDYMLQRDYLPKLVKMKVDTLQQLSNYDVTLCTGCDCVCYEWLSDYAVYEKEDSFKNILRPLDVLGMDESLAKLKNYMSSPYTNTLNLDSLQELVDWIEDEFKVLKAENNPENLEKMSQLSNVIQLVHERWSKKYKDQMNKPFVIKTMINKVVDNYLDRSEFFTYLTYMSQYQNSNERYLQIFENILMEYSVNLDVNRKNLVEYKNEISLGENMKWKTVLFKLFKDEVLIQNHQNLQLEPFESTGAMQEYAMLDAKQLDEGLRAWRPVGRPDYKLHTNLEFKIQNMVDGVKLEIADIHTGDIKDSLLIHYDELDSLLRLYNQLSLSYMKFKEDPYVSIRHGQLLAFFNDSKYEQYQNSLKNDFPSLF